MGIIAWLLTELTKKDQGAGKTIEFVWTERCKEAFQDIKKKLTIAPALQPPDLNKEFFLQTDASQVGFGAVLDDDGVRLPVTFAISPLTRLKPSMVPQS